MASSKILVVKLPRNILEIVDFARRINDSLAENASYFPSPPLPLTTFIQHIDALTEAEASVKQSTQGVIVRNNALEQLTKDIKRLANYVQLIADNNPDTADIIIKVSGFSIRQAHSGKAPQVYEVLSEEPGMVTLSAPSNPEQFPYVWEVSADNLAWTFFKTSRLSLAKGRHLVSGHLYYFRYYIVGEDNEPEPTSSSLSCRVM